MRISFTRLGLFLMVSVAGAAGSDTPAMSARDLAGRLSSVEEGTSYVRLSMEIKDSAGATKSVLQLQIKQRRTNAGIDLVYQVLWPKERRGEAVLLHKSAGSAASGSLFLPPNKPRPLSASQINDSLFGSDLSYQDVVENFFAWENQALAGTETVNRVNCLILESKPGEGEHSIYARVRSWIDARRLVPLRVEKYLSSGRLARRIDTTRVANDDEGRPIPANLTVRSGRDSMTELDGSRIKHDVTYSDSDFTPEGMTELSSPRPRAQ